MLNEEKYNSLKSELESAIRCSQAKAESWKAVEKNYNVKSNGQPYKDLKKSI